MRHVFALPSLSPNGSVAQLRLSFHCIGSASHKVRDKDLMPSSAMDPKPRDLAAARKCPIISSTCVLSRAMTRTGTRSLAVSATSAIRCSCACEFASTYTGCFNEPSLAASGSWKGHPRQVRRKGGTSKKAARYVCWMNSRSGPLPIEPVTPMMRKYFWKTRGRDMTNKRSWKMIFFTKPSWKFRHSKASDHAFGFARPDCSAQ
mmetsp:Transcript_48698/g.140035  ORF Transcript_48698/g.140035 Transcript_48698/m.140035 type:complete len:204 (-) Transcript_48698:334-945(-)